MELRSLEKFPSHPTRPSAQSRLKGSSFFLNFRQRSCLWSKNRTSLLLTGDSYGGSSSWCCQSSIGPPPPPLPEPGSSASLSGLQEKLSKIQDRVRIFLAVLFWMSLFFWGSAWDGRDDSGNKKGPFKKKFK